MMSMTMFYLLILLLSSINAFYSSTLDHSIVMTMIIRDEEVNLKSNLKLWLPFIKYFVFLVDTRTTDKSVEIIQSILEKSTAEFKILPNEFDGFGLSRTRSLQAAWRYFPQASHVWISDPDWVVDPSTIHMNDLDHITDVFGFISYDRTGITTRTMHWLLKQKDGLRMRYHVHEVLDIGQYTWKNLNWTIHEVEKPGSWHATVGHGHSMSLKRFMFDLSLLEQDLIEYGHDSHTHYYLGVTHEAVATAIIQQHGLSSNATYHIQQALKYLEFRVLLRYDREYLDDRVNCMMLLGNIHAMYLKDFQRSEYWYHMCYEYDTKVPDCGIQLANLYLSRSMLDDAYSLITAIIKIEKSSKIGISHFKSWDCDLPRIVNAVLGYRLLSNNTQFSIADAKYMILLDHMVEKNSMCAVNNAFKSSISIEAMIQLTKLSPKIGLNMKASMESMCQDEELSQYILMREVKLHSCSSVTASFHQRVTCKSFHQNIPPISEDLQVRNDKEFIGALSIPDIIHHAYQGRFYDAFVSKQSSTITNLSSSFHILLAEYFNIKSLYYLLGYAIHNPAMKFDVIIVSPDPDISQAINHMMNTCGINIPSNIRITPYIMSLDAYHTQQTQLDPSRRLYFDYIEYNGGLSLSTSGWSHVEALQYYLTPTGIIGITYFTYNSHQQRLFDLIIKRQNQSDDGDYYHLPFRDNHEHLIKSYLQLYDMDIFTQDAQFMRFFGGHSSDKAYHYHKQDDNKISFGQPYHQQEVVDGIASLGMKMLSWLPTAMSHPYEELHSKDILQFRSVGVSEAEFVEQIMPSFRYTVYVCMHESTLPGRATVTSLFPSSRQPSHVSSKEDHRINHNLKHAIIIDRLGSLGTSFQNAPILASQHVGTQFSIGHYSVMNTKIRMIALREVVDPSIAWILPHLSSSPTVNQLVDVATKHHGNVVSSDACYRLILNLLRFLESINYITFRIDVPVANHIDGGYHMYKSSDAHQHNDIHSLSLDSFYNISVEDEVISNIETTYPEILQEKLKKMKSMGFPDSIMRKAIAEYLNTNHVPMASEIDSSSRLNDHITIQGMKAKKLRQLNIDENNFNLDLTSEKEVHVASDRGSQSKPMSISPSSSHTHALEGNDKVNFHESAMNNLLETLSTADSLRNPPSSQEVESTPADLISSKLKAINELKTLEKKSERLTNMLEQLQSSATHNLHTTSSMQTNTPRHHIPAPTKHDIDELHRAMMMIQIPYHQTVDELQSSFRGNRCLSTPINDDASCMNPSTLKRKSSGVMMTSIRKLKFDIDQLRYIMTTYNLSQPYTNHMMMLESLHRLIDTNMASFDSQLIKLGLDVVDRHILNRAVYIHNHTSIDMKATTNRHHIHPEALNQLIKASTQLHDVDFIVIDALVIFDVLHDITNLLISSTIWIDQTNGQSFASYMDDGLVFPQYHSLAKELVAALLLGGNKYKVKSYYAIAMDITQESSVSPVMLGNDHDLMAVFWLQSSITCNLLVYETSLTSQLYAKGISMYPSVHSTFLSSRGSVAIDIPSSFSSAVPEIIPCQTNRLVLLNSHIPFVIEAKKRHKHTLVGSFSESVCIAFVVLLSEV